MFMDLWRNANALALRASSRKRLSVQVGSDLLFSKLVIGSRIQMNDSFWISWCNNLINCQYDCSLGKLNPLVELTDKQFKKLCIIKSELHMIQKINSK